MKRTSATIRAFRTKTAIVTPAMPPLDSDLLDEAEPCDEVGIAAMLEDTEEAFPGVSELSLQVGGPRGRGFCMSVAFALQSAN